VSAEHSFYITTPIYYLNGLPHIGHAYTTIAADAIARWRRAKGHSVRFLTGTDEHGQKVMESARARGLEPQAHCDEIVEHWKAAWNKLDIQYDRFIRTTDDDHRAVVQRVLQKLWDADLIYRADYQGWYSVTDETFVTEKDVREGKHPDPDSLQQITETNYFFRMSRYQDALLAHIEANPAFLQPASRRNEVLGFLRQPLEDLCISRPRSRMGWGIALPFDEDFVTYVWFDALLNYLTGTGYHPDAEEPAAWRAWWPADFHLIGKDILTTHAVYWSTMLLAMGLPLPRTLFAHGWWTSVDGEKISKSKGNAIDVMLLVDEFGVDATRYFFLREIAFGADGGFSYEGFFNRYNADLANDFGNLVHRALSMTSKWLGGVVPPMGQIGEAEAALVELAGAAIVGFDEGVEALQFHRALDCLWDLVRAGNKYIDSTEPWRLNREGRTAELGTAMRMTLEICALAGALLPAVMPERSAALLASLGLTPAQGAELVTRLLGGAAPLAALTEGAPVVLGEQLFPRHREMPARIAALFEVTSAAPAAAPKPVKTPKPEKKPMDTPEEKVEDPTKPLITYDDFAKLDLRAGTVRTSEKHPKADRLLVLTVDVGEPEPRTIVAGIANRYAPEELVGRQVVVVCNLKPAKLRGIVSQGMLLAAGGQDVVDLVHVGADPGVIVR
jgi:methionyl-tRNA synthetase